MTESYPKILEFGTAWSLEPSELRRVGRQAWVVTEKVHGANLSFGIEPDRISLHKRKGPVAPGEVFFGAARVLAQHELGLHALAERMRVESGAARVQLFGELYGGGYPHPAVNPVEGVQPVQTGVWYCPGVAFVAFDLAFTSAEGEHRFVGFERLREVCEASGVPVAEPLAEGSLDRALAFELGFESTLPALHGLPKLEVPNPAEGVVLRPVQETLVPTAKGPRRALLKRKLPKFAEDLRFHGAQPWAQAERLEPLVLAEREGLERINPNRVQSARSKLGPVSEVGAAPIGEEVVRDVWEELHEAGNLALLSAEERELLRAVLADAALAAVGP